MEKRQPQGLTTYAYDSMNRLSAVEYPGGKEELFYDRAGNRTRRVSGGVEELYQYDSRNRLTAHTRGGVTREYKYDNAGNLLEDGRAVYGYDAFNRCTKVETLDGNVQVNRYDAEGLRHEMEENGELVSFIFRDREVVAEEGQAGRIRCIRTGELLASDAEYARTYYHYASDEMGSITHVVADGEVLNRYEYDAWGNLTVCEETVPNRFRFNGQQYDPVSQQYYLRARYYNPVIGRFTQEDTYRGDGLNLYTYCRNNPVCYVDPSGHAVISCERAQEYMLRARDAGQRIQDIDTKTANQLRRWYQFKDKHDLLTQDERNLASQIGLDVEGKKVPNPNGKKGGTAHQSTIASIQPGRVGGEIRYEVRFDTPNGDKSRRFADVVETVNGDIVAIHQVGRVNGNGTPVIREMRAIADIMSSSDYNGAPIYFWPYNIKSGPIIIDTHFF